MVIDGGPPTGDLVGNQGPGRGARAIPAIVGRGVIVRRAAKGESGMTIWQSGLAIAPALIAAMALLLWRKRALSRGAAILVIAVTLAITLVLLSM